MILPRLPLSTKIFSLLTEVNDSNGQMVAIFKDAQVADYVVSLFNTVGFVPINEVVDALKEIEAASNIPKLKGHEDENPSKG